MPKTLNADYADLERRIVADHSLRLWDREPKRQSYRVYLYSVTNERRNPFPIDMLRYDHAWPASEADSHRIDSAINRDAVHDKIGQPIEICSLCRPNVDRWRSFGWTVKPLRVSDAA